MKKDELKELFKIEDENLLKNDNEINMENDIKNYDDLKDPKDVLRFHPLEEETLKTIIRDDKKKKEGDFSDKKHTKPNHAAYIPNEIEDGLTKSRMVSF